jgi:hypothetical protein
MLPFLLVTTAIHQSMMIGGRRPYTDGYSFFLLLVVVVVVGGGGFC